MRREELVEVQQERDQHARRQRSGADQVGAVPEHEDLGDGRQQLAAGEVERHQLHRAQASVAVLRRAGGEPRPVVVVAAERLRDPHAGEALLHLGVDDRDGVASPGVGAPRHALEPHREDGEDRQHGERDEGQAHVEDEQHDHDPGAAGDARERQQQALLEQVGERLDVRRHAGHDPPAHLAVVVVEREPLQVGERARPQRVEHPLGRVRRVQQLDDLVAPADELHEQVHDARGRHHRSAVDGHAGVDAVADEQRADERRAGVDEDEDGDERHRPAEAAHEPAQRRVAVVRRRLGEVDVGVAAQRRQGVDAGEQLGVAATSAARAPICPTAVAPPGARATEHDRGHVDGVRAAVAVLAVVLRPGRRGRSRRRRPRHRPGASSGPVSSSR